MGTALARCIDFPTAAFFWHVHFPRSSFFFSLAPPASFYTVAFVISLSIAPLFLFRQRNLPSDWGITYSEEGGGMEPLPGVRVYLRAVDTRASIRGRRTERTGVVPTPAWPRPLRNGGGRGEDHRRRYAEAHQRLRGR